MRTPGLLECEREVEAGARRFARMCIERRLTAEEISRVMIVAGKRANGGRGVAIFRECERLLAGHGVEGR